MKLSGIRHIKKLSIKDKGEGRKNKKGVRRKNGTVSKLQLVSRLQRMFRKGKTRNKGFRSRRGLLTMPQDLSHSVLSLMKNPLVLPKGILISL